MNRKGESCIKCIYCGSAVSTTQDHVLPKCLIGKPYPANLLTVPSCESCNNGFSKEEEYFRLVIVGLLCHTQEAEGLFDGPISRSMDRNSDLEDMMFGSLATIGNAVILNIDYSRIYRIAEKIVRGLEFSLSGKPFPPDQRFEVEFAETEQEGESTVSGPDFTYCRRDNEVWEFTLFNSVRFVVDPI